MLQSGKLLQHRHDAIKTILGLTVVTTETLIRGVIRKRMSRVSLRRAHAALARTLGTQGGDLNRDAATGSAASLTGGASEFSLTKNLGEGRHRGECLRVGIGRLLISSQSLGIGQ